MRRGVNMIVYVQLRLWHVYHRSNFPETIALVAALARVKFDLIHLNTNLSSWTGILPEIFRSPNVVSDNFWKMSHVSPVLIRPLVTIRRCNEI